MNYIWPLNINNFTTEDRISISNFLLDTKNRWTQDNQVKLFELMFADFAGVKYAVFVSSGSAANTILAQYAKDSVQDNKKKIVLPSTTWQTSCSPWIREGFEPVFIDISLTDFSIDLNRLDKYLENHHDEVAYVFPTSLIGYTPNIERLAQISNKYNVKIMMDNCENTLGKYCYKNVSSYFTSTTSTYFGHQIQSVEGGFIFTNSEEEYEYFLMLRNHGMTRSLPAYGISAERYANPRVNSLFDFYCLGNNYRNTDINAFIGKIDLGKANYYTERRKELYNVFRSTLSSEFYLPSDREGCDDVPFCLPIIARSSSVIDAAKKLCVDSLIEYRPIISGFLGKQTCYRKYFKDDDSYISSKILDNNGFYVGLHPQLSESQILDFTKALNSL